MTSPMGVRNPAGHQTTNWLGAYVLSPVQCLIPNRISENDVSGTCHGPPERSLSHHLLEEDNEKAESGDDDANATKGK
jgi:hypothetical protein